MKECNKAYSRVSGAAYNYPGINYIDENVVCTTNINGTGLCYGDHGNPLVQNYDTLVGIASWFFECNSRYPNVYQKVYPYLQWIKKESTN